MRALGILAIALLVCATAAPVHAQGAVTGVNSVSGQPLNLGASNQVFMTIGTTGTVGIGMGTAIAQAPLQVYGGNGGTLLVFGNIDPSIWTPATYLGTTRSSPEGLAIAWNRSAGGRETNFVNTTPGQTPGGFAFDTWDGTNFTQLMSINSSGNVGIGTAAPAGLLDLTSTTSAFVPPRMTATQMNAIVSPATGSVVFNTDASALYFYNGSSWVPVGGGVAPQYVTCFVTQSGASGNTFWMFAGPDITGTVYVYAPSSMILIGSNFASYSISTGQLLHVSINAPTTASCQSHL